jgi:hypothetical protein
MLDAISAATSPSVTLGALSVVVPATGTLSPETIDAIADAVWAKALGTGLAATLLQTAATESTKGRKMQTNRATISGDERTVSIYDDDGMTLLHTFAVSTDKNTRQPA